MTVNFLFHPFMYFSVVYNEHVWLIKLKTINAFLKEEKWYKLF